MIDHLGIRIKIARITKGMKQQELAEKINKTRPLISAIEQTGKVNILTLRKICKVLDLDPYEMENFAEPSTRIKPLNRESRLEEENAFLKREVERLQELVDSLKYTVSLLKEKYERKK